MAFFVDEKLEIFIQKVLEIRLFGLFQQTVS